MPLSLNARQLCRSRRSVCGKKSIIYKDFFLHTWNYAPAVMKSIKYKRSNNLVQLVLCTRERNNLVRWSIGKSLETHLMSPKWQMSFGLSRILTLFLFTRNIIFITFNHPQLSLRAFFLLFLCGLASVQMSVTFKENTFKHLPLKFTDMLL